MLLFFIRHVIFSLSGYAPVTTSRLRRHAISACCLMIVADTLSSDMPFAAPAFYAMMRRQRRLLLIFALVCL